MGMSTVSQQQPLLLEAEALHLVEVQPHLGGMDLVGGGGNASDGLVRFVRRSEERQRRAARR